MKYQNNRNSIWIHSFVVLSAPSFLNHQVQIPSKTIHIETTICHWFVTLTEIENKKYEAMVATHSYTHLCFTIDYLLLLLPWRLSILRSNLVSFHSDIFSDKIWRPAASTSFSLRQLCFLFHYDYYQGLCFTTSSHPHPPTYTLQLQIRLNPFDIV